MRYLLLVLLMVTELSARAGIVRGLVTDTQNQPLAFANVAVRATTTSTATNEQGRYQLRLEPGQYELVFQYVGFKPRLQTVRVAGGDTATVLNVQLTPENYQLNEVVVRASDRDPAYALVQQAINWRRYHEREVAAYRARLYVKALGRLSDVPGKVLGLVKIGPDIKPGIFYLSETISDITFRQPNVIQEKMLSSRVSGDSKRVSFNIASAGKGLNFYSNLLKSSFSQRGFVSPIASNAMLFYQYELVGSTQQGNLLIHKIRVTPRRRADPAFSGFIYLIDGTWRLYSVSLDLDKSAQLEYVDHVHLEQQFMPAPGPSGVWVIQSQKATATFEAFGFKGSANATAVLSNYSVVPTYSTPQQVAAPPAPEPVANAPVERETVADVRKQRPTLRGLNQKVKQRLRRSNADSINTALGIVEPLRRGEIQRVEAGATNRDSAFWNEARPVPLTEEEQLDYHVKDSTEVVRNSRPYQDSLDRKRNELGVGKLLLSGYTHNNTFAKRRLYVRPVFNILQYNTVEGVVANAEATYTQDTDDRRRFQFTPIIRYGFAAKLLSPSAQIDWQLDPVVLRRLTVQVGRTVENFAENTQLTPFINSAYTLLRNRNYAKLYQRRGAEVAYLTEITNGLTVRGAVNYYDRRELFNNTYDLLIDVPGRAFTPNTPANAELVDTGFGRSQALTLELTATYQPGQRFLSRPDGKVNLYTRKPQFRFTFLQGVPSVFGSDVRYTRLAAGIRQSVQMGLFGTGTYDVAGGGYLGSPRLQFMDYRHFAGNQTILTGNFAQFQLLDYYQYSTRRAYLEAHYNQHFNGFFLNKVPLLRRLKWQEVASVNYLHTRAAGHYVELGVGIEHIFNILRIDGYTALQSGERVGTGVRIGLGF
ncbi:carboxypeptidase-like regulatory domain-containing protein [Hymenobacter sp. BT507]|uniref:Carboxypeptidase-like regulatory domain-containing protein n=1 Tax=Hymenobacter citatus TaxID=2763506 RepID=A0ABR7MGL2_9BACT|nr:DUF5686 and carboxypeptidase regulatory-like domain-containing protein [Hymenobacter citatus]MBC6610220.1 carboxypeptidase-like regulatory domain-containing protein [Hymenobacter citatus]